METQTNIGDQNTQQVGRSLISPSADFLKRFGANPLTVGVVVLVCLVIFGFGGYFVGKQSQISMQNDTKRQKEISSDNSAANIEKSLPAWTQSGYNFSVDWSGKDNDLTIKYLSNNCCSSIPFSSPLFINRSFKVFPSFYKGMVYHEFILKPTNDPRFKSIYLQRLDWNQIKDVINQSGTIPEEYRGSFLGFENYSQRPLGLVLDKTDMFISANGITFYWQTKGGPKSYDDSAVCASTDYIDGEGVSDRIEICQTIRAYDVAKFIPITPDEKGQLKKGLIEVVDTITHR